MPTLDTKDYLRLVEKAKTIACWDTESQGLNGDYGSIIVVSIKPYGKPPTTFKIEQLGNDKRVVREAKEALDSFDCWVTYYGKGHDVPLMNTRLLKWGLPPLAPRHHLDMYFTLKYKLRTARHSQAHLLNWLETPQKKMSVGADVWAGLSNNFTANMSTITKRCESDCAGLEALYNRTKHLVREVKRG